MSTLVSKLNVGKLERIRENERKREKEREIY